MNNPAISCLDLSTLDESLDTLAGILHACVHNGASVNFIMPFSVDDSRKFWVEKIRPGVASGDRILLVATIDERIAGTVQLDCGTSPNQAHRAGVSKLLVHPDCRRRGIAKALMLELESQAALMRRSLLTLDTRTGDSAEPLYASLGYETAGVIPGFAKDPHTDKLDGTTYMFKQL